MGFEAAVGMVGGFFRVAGDCITGDEMLVWPMLNPLESPIPIGWMGMLAPPPPPMDEPVTFGWYREPELPLEFCLPKREWGFEA